MQVFTELGCSPLVSMENSILESDLWSDAHTLQKEKLSHLLLLPDPNTLLYINTEPDLNGKLAKRSSSRFGFPQIL